MGAGDRAVFGPRPAKNPCVLEIGGSFVHFPIVKEMLTLGEQMLYFRAFPPFYFSSGVSLVCN